MNEISPGRDPVEYCGEVVEGESEEDLGREVFELKDKMVLVGQVQKLTDRRQQEFHVHSFIEARSVLRLLQE